MNDPNPDLPEVAALAERLPGCWTAFLFLLAFGVVGMALSLVDWALVSLWLTYKALWWFLPLCSLVAFLIVLATAVWSAIREPRS